MKRITTLIISVLALALFAVGCARPATDASAAEPAAMTDSAAASEPSEAAGTEPAPATEAAPATGAASDMLELTLEELEQYDGKDGNPAYVAVDGVIYDVTNVSAWSNGAHKGYFAGNDLTDIIKNKSPHGVKNLEGLPVVGKIVDG
jgi:predicted heme/steroid binding protein